MSSFDVAMSLRWSMLHGMLEQHESNFNQWNWVEITIKHWQTTKIKWHTIQAQIRLRYLFFINVTFRFGCLHQTNPIEQQSSIMHLIASKLEFQWLSMSRKKKCRFFSSFAHFHSNCLFYWPKNIIEQRNLRSRLLRFSRNKNTQIQIHE